MPRLMPNSSPSWPYSLCAIFAGILADAPPFVKVPGNGGDDDVGNLHKWTHDRQKIFPAENGAQVCGHDGEDAHRLAHEAEAPTAHYFKKNQHAGEREEDCLPEWRTGSHGIADFKLRMPATMPNEC